MTADSTPRPTAATAARVPRGRAALLDRLEAQAEAVERASRICADAIGGGGLVHVFGTGHSRIPVEELFPRYGSYPGFNPIVELSMTFHTQVVGANGQRQAMFIERVEGLAETILANFELGPPDAMIVFSAGGLTAVPIEMAMGAPARGLPVIAVTSVAQSLAGEPTHSSGTRLLDHADVVLDLCTPPGDALVALDGRRHARRAGLVDRGGRARERSQGAHRASCSPSAGRSRRCSRARRSSAASDRASSSTPPTPSTRGGSRKSSRTPTRIGL